MKREIKVPSPVTLGSKIDWSLFQCVEHLVNALPVFNESGVGIRAGIRLLDAFRDKESGAPVLLEREDWAALREAFNNPGRVGFCPPLIHRTPDGRDFTVPVPARSFVAFMNAVDDATEK